MRLPEESCLCRKNTILRCGAGAGNEKFALSGSRVSGVGAKKTGDGVVRVLLRV